MQIKTMLQKLTGFLGSNGQLSKPTTDVWLSLHRGVSVRSGYSLAMGTHLPGLQTVHEMITMMNLKRQVGGHNELWKRNERAICTWGAWRNTSYQVFSPSSKFGLVMKLSEINKQAQRGTERRRLRKHQQNTGVAMQKGQRYVGSI